MVDKALHDLERVTGRGPRKRRKTLSCELCRSRKLSCNRQDPCERCIKGGIVDRCVYSAASCTSDVNLTQSEKQPPTLPEKDIFEGSEKEQDNHERTRLHKFSCLQRAVDSAPGVTLGSPRECQTTSESMYSNGAGFDTLYFGATAPATAILKTPKIMTFIKAAVTENPSIVRFQHDMSNLMARRKRDKRAYGRADANDLLKLLPEKFVVDPLIDMYLSTIEMTYRILHVPTFLHDYQLFWTQKPQEKSMFVVILLLIIAIARNLMPQANVRCVGDSSLLRELAILHLEACESWLNSQSRKRSPLEQFQVRILMYITRRTNAIQKKKEWSEVVNLLTTAITAGYHRDPSKLKNISIFEGEMRRRLWATVVELETECAFGHGVDSRTSGFSDCAEPRNIDDEQMSPIITELPIGRPETWLTRISYLRMCARSRNVRLSLITTLNNPNEKLDFDAISTSHTKFNQLLEELSLWSEHDSKYEMPKQLLRIQLWDYITVGWSLLSNQYKNNPRNHHGITCVLQSSMHIIQTYREFYSNGEWFPALIRHTPYRAVIILCQKMAEMYPTEHVGELSLKKLESEAVYLKQCHAVEKCLDLLEEIIIRRGQGTRYYWYTAAAIWAMQSCTKPETSSRQRDLIVDKILRFYNRMVELQDELGRIIPDDLKKSTASEQMGESGLHLDMVENVPLTTGYDFPLIEDWGFDDLWNIQSSAFLDIPNMENV